MTDSDGNEWEDQRPSKSELKRQMHALQEMGERLVRLPRADLDRIQIDDERLKEAVEMARGIRARGGLKRQLQFIGKLMRSVDIEPIAKSLAILDQQHNATTAGFHRVELARDRLRTEGDAALGDILAIWPDAEISLLRQWIRQHPREVERGNAKAHSKKLFRYLSGLDNTDCETS